MGKQISLDEKDQLKKAAIDAVAKLGGPSRIARKLGVSPGLYQSGEIVEYRQSVFCNWWLVSQGRLQLMS